VNSYMNIQVRVIGAGARAQLMALQKVIASMNAQTAAGSAATARNTAATNANAAAKGRLSAMTSRAAASMATFNTSMHSGVTRMNKWGNQVQWTGRQLQRNWTMPLLLAGGAAVKFALDNEKSFVHTRKVYGDASAAAQFYIKQSHGTITADQAAARSKEVFAAELEALEDNFRALSEQYGVNLAKVNEISGAWAAAGFSGRDLAKSVEATMQAIQLGNNMDPGVATRALISTQAQYNLSSDELIDTLYLLNAVENQTGIELEGLIQGFQRSAGVARAAGVSTRELAAQLAALVPTAGSAAQAGNALKTIYSRLLAPTGDMVDILGEMNINIADQSWKSATLSDRLKMVTKSFNGMGDAQRAAAASILGSRWQFNKLIILLDEMERKNSFYHKALNATTDETKIFNQAQQELNAILDSSPNKFARVWASIQNGMAQAIGPLIPVLLSLFNGIRMGVDAFQRLSPEMQKFWVMVALGVAILPVIVVYVGSLVVLIATLARVFLTVVPILAIATGGLAKFAAALLITGPFHLFMGLVGAAGAVVMGFGRVLGINAIATKAWAVLTKAIHTAFWGYTILLYLAGYTKMQALTAAGQVKIAALWAAGFTWIKAQIATFWAFAAVGNIVGWARQIAITIAGSLAMNGAWKMGFVKMWGTMMLMMSAIWLGFTTHLLAMAGSVVTFGGKMGVLWSTMWAVIGGIFVTFREFMLVQFAIMRAGLFAIWVQMHLGLTAITAAFSKGMTALWAFMHLKMSAITVVLGGGLSKVWGALHIAMAAITKGFWTQVIRMWIVGMTILMGSPKMLLMIFKRVFIAVASALLSPWAIAIAAVLALAYTFRDQIVNLWGNITSYFSDSSNGMVKAVLSSWNALPQGVSNALVAVARVIAAAVRQISEWLSYLNPFARHSPSLVDNVTAGTARIGELYGAMTATVAGHIKGAARDIKAYGAAVAHLLKGAASFDEAQNRAKIKKFAPGALDEYIQLSNRLKQLTKDLAGYQKAMDAQQAVVDRWQDKLDAANAALDKQQDILDRLTDTADAWKDKLDAANASLDHFASAPLEGMHEAAEAMFANEMAQKALRLEMMRIEEVTGPLDELKSKMDAINGAQELLRGEQSALRSAGAGSEVLSGYQDQIDLLDQQKVAFEDAIAPLNAMQNELDELQRQAEMMDLENSLKFDPLTHAIENAANAMEELPFDEVMAGITAAQADIALYTTKWEEANAAVQAQQAVVDAATAARDKLQDSLDREEAKLAKIKDAYEQVNEAIRDIETAMNDVMSAADKMSDKLSKSGKGGGAGSMSPALEAFNAAEGGNFPNVGGSGIPMRGDWESQVGDIEAMTKDLEAKTADMFSKLNPFVPIKEKAKQFFAWISSQMDVWGAGFKDFFVSMLGGPEGAKKAGDTFQKILATVRRVFNKIVKIAKSVWALLGPDIMEFVDIIIDTVKDIWKEIGPELAKFGTLVQPLMKILGVIGVIALAVIKIVLSTFNGVLRPVLGGLVTMIKGIVQVVRGVIGLVSGLLTGDWELIWRSAVDIVVGLFNILWGFLKGIFGGIWGLVEGFVKGIWGFFKWLWDVLFGHSIIPDIIDAFWKWFGKLVTLGQWVWNNVIKPIWNFIKKLWSLVGPELRTWGARIKAAWNNLMALGRWVWENVLKPIWDKFVNAKTNIMNAVEAIRTGFREKFESMRQKASDVVDWIRDIPQKLKDQASKWKAAGKSLIDAFVDGMKNAAGIITGIAGNVWDTVRDLLNAAIDKINSALEFDIGFSAFGKDIKKHIDPTDIPHIYTGGIVRGSQKGMLAVLGDKGYDEAVIPIEGPWAPKVGSRRDGMRSDAIGHRGGETHLHFYGDLEFPNVKDGSDAKDLIDHLTILAEGA
jgi:TP901 family phage tail tape measure protein